MSGAEVYQGRRKPDGALEILADGEPLDIKPSLKVSNHSPTGFECGYGGSGPAQSALAILLDYTGKRNFAARFHQDFKWKYTSPVPENGFIVTADAIDQFIVEMKAEELKEGRPLCDDCLCEDHSQEERCWQNDCKCGKVARV